MLDLLTPDDVAALLTARGYTDRSGGPVKPDTVRRQLARGLYPGAIHLPGRRGLWLIPRAAAEAFEPPKLGKPRRQPH